jgi:hypothetical protein
MRGNQLLLSVCAFLKQSDLIGKRTLLPDAHKDEKKPSFAGATWHSLLPGTEEEGQGTKSKEMTVI